MVVIPLILAGEVVVVEVVLLLLEQMEQIVLVV